MKKYIACLILVIAPSLSYAAWTQLGQTDKFTFYVDANFVQVDGSKRIAWTLFNYKVPDNSGAKSVQRQHEYDCARRSLRMLQHFTYPEHFAEGGNITKNLQVNGDWVNIAPNSANEQVLNFICQR